MTEPEAFARAEALWGDGGVIVTPCPGFPGEWLVETAGRPHLMDAAGAPTCHHSCIVRAEEMQP